MPDPSWPEPPAEWQLWLDDTAARRDRRVARLRSGSSPSRRLTLGVVASLAAISASVLVTTGATAGTTQILEPVAASAAPGTTHVLPLSPGTTHVLPLSPAPSPVAPSASMQMGCPVLHGTSRVLDASFTHMVLAQAPYTVAIDYGDGHTYRGDDAHLGAVFSHTYARSGSFTVKAVVQDANGASASASCALTWSQGADQN